jgi:hypothetical protein
MPKFATLFVVPNGRNLLDDHGKDVLNPVGQHHKRRQTGDRPPKFGQHRADVRPVLAAELPGLGLPGRRQGRRFVGSNVPRGCGAPDTSRWRWRLGFM